MHKNEPPDEWEDEDLTEQELEQLNEEMNEEWIEMNEWPPTPMTMTAGSRNGRAAASSLLALPGSTTTAGDAGQTVRPLSPLLALCNLLNLLNLLISHEI